MNYRELWANGEIEAGTLVDAIESQAREIERLKRSAQTNWNEFADTVKAQPSGVVLPPMVEFDDMVNRLFELDGDARKYCCRHWLLTLWKATLDRVCQLNASPVSAGGVDERAAFEAAWVKHYKVTLPEFHPSKHRVGESYNPEYSPFIGTAWWAWQQARAALTASAPNHSELEVLREYRNASINYTNSHGVETGTLEEGVEIERKAEARLEAAEKACHDFYAGREAAPSHSEQVRRELLERICQAADDCRDNPMALFNAVEELRGMLEVKQ